MRTALLGEHHRLPLKEPGPFRQVMLVMGLLALVSGLFTPFYAAALLEHLSYSIGAVTALDAFALLIAALTSSWWGRLIDQRGEGWALGLLIALTAASPLLLIAAQLVGLPAVIMAYVLHGTSSLGALPIITMSLMMRTAPQRHRAMHIAGFWTVNGLVGFLSPLVAGFFIDHHIWALFAAGSALAWALLLILLGPWGTLLRETTRRGAPGKVGPA